MNKLGNKKENEIARIKISLSLIHLMEKKALSKITVSDLVQDAGVARATFYRNFHSMEEVAVNYVDLLHKDILATGLRKDQNIVEKDDLEKQLAFTMDYLKERKNEILCLYRNGFGILLLEMINQYTALLLGDMPARSIDSYMIYYISGALFNVLIRWLQDDTPEPAGALSAWCTSCLTGKRGVL